MAINFPDSPSQDQIVNISGKSYIWNGNAWVGYSATTVTLATSAAGGGNIGWTTSGQYRTATTFKENGNEYTIRNAAFSNNLLRFEVASFTPSFSASGQSLSWDQPASSFSVSVNNPSDFTSRWIDNVTTITQIGGLVYPTLADYNAGTKSATPAGGVDWTQTFTTNGTTYIRSTTNNSTTGGSATGRLTFVDNNNDVYGTADFTTTWQNASVSISMSNLSTKKFLDYHTSTSYSVSVSGISNPANYFLLVSSSGGTISNPSGGGTFTFTDPLHKDNNSGRSVSVGATFSRPVAVTGTAYDVTASSSDTSISASFTYPSFYYWTTNTSTPPTRADLVDSYDFSTGATELGNQTKTISATINNTDPNPRAFWFGVRSSASQPTTFQTGPSASLLSDVSVTTGNTVNLEPDTPLAGYVAESYTLYGITLQPGNTYVNIN